ncbi:hypothetical protein BD560DRAFT_429293 [Blakeslea trispora]|nr:hypothetical protein BD560DRAFT_429293 [Blakeslea trispora]
MSQLVDNDDCHLFLYQNNTHELDCHCHEAAKYIVYNPKKDLIVFMTMNSTREEDKKGQRKGIKPKPQHLKILRDNLDYLIDNNLSKAEMSTQADICTHQQHLEITSTITGRKIVKHTYSPEDLFQSIQQYTEYNSVTSSYKSNRKKRTQDETKKKLSRCRHVRVVIVKIQDVDLEIQDERATRKLRSNTDTLNKDHALAYCIAVDSLMIQEATYSFLYKPQFLSLKVSWKPSVNDLEHRLVLTLLYTAYILPYLSYNTDLNVLTALQL